MAELLDIASPLALDATGTWNGERFEVVGQIQMDRAEGPSAPWQETLVWLVDSDRQCWVAYAQGRWYATSEVVVEPGMLPPPDRLRPGARLHLRQHGGWVVQEVGARKVVSGAGQQTAVPAADVATRFADISGARGAFGTIDYGDGQSPPVLYLGQQFAIESMVLDATGMPPELSSSKVTQLECPTCGGVLPLMSQQAERVVCRYCGTASDVAGTKLEALGPAPPLPVPPKIPIGSEGQLRGVQAIVVGFVIRSCRVEGVTYSWREYLLFYTATLSYGWLVEDEGKWQLVQPLEAGDVMDGGGYVTVAGVSYGQTQSVQARVDYVIGEFYWKVEIGETVDATEFEGPGGKLSRERTATEVNYTFVTPLDPQELAAFGVTADVAFKNLEGHLDLGDLRAAK